MPSISATPHSTTPAASVGLGTTTPFDMFHVRFTNTGGNFTGLAVQNLGNTATSYSGMLFYDQNNQLGAVPGLQQRHPRIPHQQRRQERRQPVRRLDQLHDRRHLALLRRQQRQHRHWHDGAGSANFEVSNALSTTAQTIANLTSYGNNWFGSNLIGRKARGTAAAPAAVLNNDSILDLAAQRLWRNGVRDALARQHSRMRPHRTGPTRPRAPRSLFRRRRMAQRHQVFG